MTNKKPQKLSELDAAIYLETSRELIDYFTRNSVKSGETRKLGFTEKDGLRWFEKSELDEYNAYLQAPWPKKKDAQRPHLPKKIRQDIMLEANSRCPVCCHEIAGEAAHIDPVSVTMSHHPANLIWLCPTHHTVADQVAVAANIDMDVIRALKKNLVWLRMFHLKAEQAASSGFLQLIHRVETIAAMLGDAKLAEAKKGLEAMAEHDVDTLEEIATKLVADPPAKPSPNEAQFQLLASSIKTSIKSLRKRGNAFNLVAEEASRARAKYLDETGQVDCPVCHGDGTHHGSPCDACGGEGALAEHRARWIDAADYDLVDCPLCIGSRRHDGEDCPECGAEGRYQKRYRDQYEPAAYREVHCPVCEGSGRRHGEGCPACHGERQMEKRIADQIDRSAYDEVDCPVCAEFGDNPDCRLCEGSQRIEARIRDQIDLDDFRLRDCKLCKGSGSHKREDCPACGGEGEMEGRRYQDIDWTQWDMVACPKCNGKGGFRYEDCRYCNGEGKMYRQQTWYLD